MGRALISFRYLIGQLLVPGVDGKLQEESSGLGKFNKDEHELMVVSGVIGGSTLSQCLGWIVE